MRCLALLLAVYTIVATDAFQTAALPLRSISRKHGNTAKPLKMIIILPPSASPLPGDMESVFGERLISSYGALPDLHASNHITIILTMTLLPCMALVAMYILINSPELQTKVEEPEIYEGNIAMFDDEYLYSADLSELSDLGVGF